MAFLHDFYALPERGSQIFIKRRERQSEPLGQVEVSCIVRCEVMTRRQIIQPREVCDLRGLRDAEIKRGRNSRKLDAFSTVIRLRRIATAKAFIISQGQNRRNMKGMPERGALQ